MEGTGEVIRRRREELGLSQSDAAGLVGMDARQWRRYESGEREPSLSLSKAIAAALQITLGELAGEPSQRVTISGTWYTNWQSWFKGEEIFNPQAVHCVQHGDVITVEAGERGTPLERGGYLWRGEWRLWDNEILMGWYAGAEGAVRSKGVVYFTLHAHGQSGIGRWTGLSHDGDLITGWATLATTKEETIRLMDELKTRPVTPT